MMKMKSILAIVIGIFWLLTVVISAVTAYRYKSAVTAQHQAEKEQQYQAQVIRIQNNQWQRLNELSEKALQTNLRASTQSEENINEFRTVLRRQKTCDIPVPDDIAQRLYRYTQDLRAGTVPATAGSAAATRAGSLTPGHLSYCQAVLWIYPLLNAINNANHQLQAISQADKLRGRGTAGQQ
ncbi:hypothetical protein GTPT_2026 [Tatumella ptyseos ATCC 33301]|uniref:Uncharacterized protein n=2 Tax=Tatumella ptyseos TaxID=82987 RepID=A0A085JF42_9GAMM|nr:hypothetical protein [Tatumella ptyseos]KFD19088.1 hypothetical protein GTPT_2026 [Tatumella ptyseos ATCC 33301]SQK75219.1 Uncharacterised protein [Tatumella ptyseos]